MDVKHHVYLLTYLLTKRYSLYRTAIVNREDIHYGVAPVPVVITEVAAVSIHVEIRW